jgi:plasmid stabilization system protein ParE
MPTRYVLAPQAAADLVEIWHYLNENANTAVADRVEGTILDRIAFLAGTPGAGHRRRDLPPKM